jgi:hypothetical protein
VIARFIAVSGSPIDDDWSKSRSVIFDRASRTWIQVPGTAFAAGDWLAWQQDDTVNILNVADAD